LSERWDLQGVGHLEYPPSYNSWLYRRKGAVLGRALVGRPLDTALDLGSGTGWVIRQLLDRGAGSVTGIELTEVAVEQLRRDLPALTFHQLDLGTATLPAGTSTIDVVTMLDVAYHLVADEELDHVLAEISRVLRVGGIAIITDEFGSDSYRPADHVHFRSHSQWTELLAMHSLRIERTVPYFKSLSRPRDTTWRHWIHPRVRGPLEWAMDTALPLTPWLRLAVIGPTDR
jgi:SAM-dependent methyltransferase